MEADTRLCVLKAGGVSGKTLSIYLSGFWQRTELTSMGFPQRSRGALFTVLTCPVYAQRLMLFANHILWKLTNGARHATLRGCQLPSQQLAVSRTVCGSVRKQLSLSICLAVTFSNTCDLCLHAWGLSSLRGLPSSLWTDKWNAHTPAEIKKKGGKKRHSWNYIILCWSNSSKMYEKMIFTFRSK